jgi:hypothetical protein
VQYDRDLFSFIGGIVMHIHQRHLYHGAALIQIAEHPEFTAINPFLIDGENSHNAYRINDNTGIYAKYASNPNASTSDYLFTFNQENLDELANVDELCGKLFVALICISSSSICCLGYDQLMTLIQMRSLAIGHPEGTYSVLVRAPAGRSFRVNVNRPGRRGQYLPRAEIVVARNKFPRDLFEIR